jgi:hypothetical protein
LYLRRGRTVLGEVDAETLAQAVQGQPGRQLGPLSMKSTRFLCPPGPPFPLLNVVANDERFSLKKLRFSLDVDVTANIS